MTLLVRQKFRGKYTQGEGYVETEAEIGVMNLQAREHGGLPAATRSWARSVQQIRLQKPTKGADPANILIWSSCLASRTVRK